MVATMANTSRKINSFELWYTQCVEIPSGDALYFVFYEISMSVYERNWHKVHTHIPIQTNKPHHKKILLVIHWSLIKILLPNNCYNNKLIVRWIDLLFNIIASSFVYIIAPFIQSFTACIMYHEIAPFICVHYCSIHPRHFEFEKKKFSLLRCFNSNIQ